MITLQDVIDNLSSRDSFNDRFLPVVLTADDFDGEGDFIALDEFFATLEAQSWAQS